MIKKLKVCRKNGKPRLWLEGAALTEFCWTKGDKFSLVYGDINIIVLKRDKNGNKTVSGRDRNGAKCPIIDIVGRDVKALDSYSEIKAFFTVNEIRIQGLIS